jgi:hypothetical protein
MFKLKTKDWTFRPGNATDMEAEQLDEETKVEISTNYNL